MSIAHSQLETTLTGDTVVDRSGRPTPVLATAAQAFSDNTDSVQKAISSSPSAYDKSPFSAEGQQLGGGSPLGETPVPVTIPPRDPSAADYRTLVLCFDGTGDQFDADNSNIVQLVASLKKSDRSKQMVYYQAGIGTYTAPKIATPFMSSIRKTLDEMFAWNLHAHVMSGYEFLMQNYIAGDRICIFGFSRGAYTARSLAGMIHKVGLLPKDNFQQVPFAYKMFKRADHVGWEQSTEFKKAFSVDVNIEFVGVWDTVDSVGIIPKRLPFTTSNTIVRTFRHAVALDERRAKFKANLWNRPDADELKLGKDAVLNASNTACALVDDDLKVHHHHPPKTNGKNGQGSGHNDHQHQHKTRKESDHDRKLNTMERMYSTASEQTTDIEEVWFAGCHCDVGGGSVSNKTRNSLARITLRWMIRECFKTNTGIMFDSQALRSIGLDPSTLYPFVTPRAPPLPLGSNRIAKVPSNPIPVRLHAHLVKKRKEHPEVVGLSEGVHASAQVGTEEEEELKDALSPAYDQLTIKKAWWALEILPLQLRYQRGNNQWVTYIGSNMARPRFIPKQAKNGVKVHRSVKLRMEAEYEDARRKGKKYSPRAHFHVEPTWID